MLLAPQTAELSAYLQHDETIDWHHSNVLELAQNPAENDQSDEAVATRCFEWVRDHIRHSADYRCNPVTWKASDVLQYETGFYYAKAHLLAALLRAVHMAAGFCYQRLRVDDANPAFCLHSLATVYLEKYGWHRLDPRGNTAVIETPFTPPAESLAYNASGIGEIDFPERLLAPLPVVLKKLKQHRSYEQICNDLPDWEFNSICGPIYPLSPVLLTNELSKKFEIA